MTNQSLREVQFHIERLQELASDSTIPHATLDYALLAYAGPITRAWLNEPAGAVMWFEAHEDGPERLEQMENLFLGRVAAHRENAVGWVFFASGVDPLWFPCCEIDPIPATNDAVGLARCERGNASVPVPFPWESMEQAQETQWLWFFSQEVKSLIGDIQQHR